jgi:hypothetical protein
MRLLNRPLNAFLSSDDDDKVVEESLRDAGKGGSGPVREPAALQVQTGESNPFLFDALEPDHSGVSSFRASS